MLVICSCPEKIGARQLARIVLEERLAACVQITSALESMYHWQGKLEQATEVLLLLKSSKACWPALRDRLAELHPYEVPEILALDVADGLPAYLTWVSASVCAEQPHPRAGATTLSGTMLNAGTAARRTTDKDVGGSARTSDVRAGGSEAGLSRHGRQQQHPIPGDGT